MYWIGGTGTWNDIKHWSLTSGGVSGTAIPDLSDDVLFDQNSFSSDKQTVMVTSNAVCGSISWSSIDQKAIFSSSPSRSITVYGSYQLSPLLINGFKGKTIFAATTPNNTITTYQKIIIGNWEFNGTGSWGFSDNVNMDKNASISLIKGSLNTNGKSLECGSFIGNSTQSRSLFLSNSEILIKDIWDFSVSSNLTFDCGTSIIVFPDTILDSKYKPGGLRYSTVTFSPMLTNTTTCVFAGVFTINMSADSVTCNGLNNGQAHCVVVGGTGPFLYDWNFAFTPAGDGTPNISALGASTNTVKITDVGTGLIRFCSISVGEPSLLFDYEVFTHKPTCFGLCNGMSDVDVTGGTPPYTYSWSGGYGTNDTAINMCDGTYTVTVTDSRGCKDSSAVIAVIQPALLVAPGSASMVSCFGFCDGTATVFATGGTLPYAYNWSPGAPIGDLTATASSLCPGPYSCTVTDFNGCIATFNTSITQPLALTLAVSHTNASCGGVCDGTATATVSGGTTPYVYSWSNGSVISTVSTTNTISSLCAGVYIITITDANGCTLNTSVTITEPLVLVATATGVNVSCFGLCTGTASVVVVGGNGGNTYDWTPGIPVGDGTANISSLCPGTYTVLVTDSKGCNDTGAVTITQPALLLANPVGSDVLCFGACNGSAISTPTGGTIPYSYNWSPGAPTGDLTATITNLCPGVYSVLVTDANLCTSNQSVSITQPAVLNAGETFTNVTCNGACNGTATATPTGGTAGYTYLWSPGLQTTATISGLCPGVYVVTVTDANGCTDIGSVTITQPNILTVGIVSTTIACNGDCNANAVATIVGGTGPFAIDWLPGSPVGDGTTIISSLCAGAYSVNIVDAHGCLATANNLILQPTALTHVTFTTDASCFGVCDGVAATIAGGGTPGYSYLWTPGLQNTSSIIAQCAGSYTATVTDFNGCTLSDTVVIDQPNQLFSNPSVVSNISCSGLCDGSATSAATGGTVGSGYIFDWTPGSPLGDGTATITALCAGTYNLTVTDSNLCTSTMPVTITQPAVLSAPITSATSSCNVCNGTATVTPVGGTAPYTYLWNDGAAQTTQTAVGLCPNVTYIVTVTDAHGCVTTNTVTILQTIIISITTSNTTLSCFGACDGIATANASGVTIPYVFIWTGPSGIVSLTQTAVGLCAGTYTVNVSDAAGCFNIDSVTFTNPPQLIVSATSTNLTCGGICTGTGTASSIGGSGVYSYLWSDGQITSTATALCAGTYSVTVTDINGCTDSTQVTITQPPLLVDNVTITPANCTFADGVISVAPTGGTPPYSYNWGGAPTGDGTPTITNLLPGVYTLVITDFSGCVFNFNYLLSNLTGPAIVMSHTNISCFGACNGTATATASGGAGGYIYDWAPGAPVGDGSPVITALCGTATYTIQVTDAAGCIKFDTAKIINPALITPNPTVVNESCGGTCDGSISLAPTGGTGGYTYLWTGGQITSSISGLCAGAYSFTVTDANGCDSSLTITLVSPPVLIVTLSSTNVLCNSACNGTATAGVVGGTGPGTYTYSWLPAPPLGPGFPLPNVIGLCPNSYTVTVTDANGCTAADTVLITQPVALTSVTSQTNASCFGVCDGQALVTASGGTIPYSYLWNPGAIANDTASGLCAGSYNATVTDLNGCVSSPPAVVISEPAAIVPNATGVNSSCNASCNGTATANPTGGSGVYTYLWNDPLGQTTQTAVGLCAGTYLVTVDDGNCAATQNVTLVDPPVLNANPTSISPTCANGCDGSVTSSPLGGTGGYTYSWSPGGAITPTVNSLCPNIYTVTVTDANNCKDTVSLTLFNTLPIDIIVGSTPANCGACDGTISITPITGTPAYSYVWTIGGIAPPPPFAGNGTSSVSNVCAGLYSVLVTDANGCDSVFTIPMNNSSGPTGEVVTTTPATCNGVCNGTGSIIPVGGVPPYTFLWNDGPATANDSASNLCAGNYFVQVTDGSGCIHFSPVTIAEPLPILDNAVITSALCSNICTGAITVAPTGGTAGYTYDWSPGAPAGDLTPAVTGLCSGTYTLLVTDSNLCTKIDSFVVTQSTPLSATIAATNISCASICNGMAYVTITSGTAPFTIQWNDPAGQTNDTATALCAGNYSIEITDALGCILTLNTTVNAAPAILANAVISGATCGLCDGSATLAPSGGTAGYTYLWSNGQTTATATTLCSGLYTVNITDAVGCVSSVPIPVSNTGGPSSATITSLNNTCNGSCNGAVIAITPVGGVAPYTFLWISSGLTTSTLSGLCAGTYFVQITDANGCSLLDSVIITEPGAILANQVISAATCGACDGSITVAASGGVLPYTYLWNTGSISPAPINLCAGVYSVDITDANGCVQNVMIPLNSQSGPTLTASSTNVSCNGSCNGTANVVATGSSPFAYLWNEVSLQTTPITTATLCAGTYFVQVTDAAGCVSIASTNITEPDSIGFSIANALDPLCNGNANGSITVIPSGGTLSYTYSWTPAPAFPQTTATAINLDANTYIVTVTDANGCAATQSVTLINPVSLTISSTSVNSSCNTTPDGSIDVTVGGGTLPYSYLWSGGSSAITEDLVGILSGSYTITVTDSNACTIADTIILLPNQSVFANAGNDTSFCQSGTLTLSAAGSINGVNYQWFDMTNTLIGSSVTLTFNPPAGTNSFYVIVDNGTGCIDSDTIVVTANPLPSVNAGADVAIILGGTATLGGSPTTSTVGATIQWTPLPGALDNPVASNPVASPITTTTYTVSITSLQGCVASDSVVVTVRPGIVFPDGISPNGDGANDEWIIDGIEMFPDCQVEVYNRWGELLFQSAGYKEHWKGTYKGKPLPVGTYYYIIDLKDPLYPDAYTGPITIMR
ncbi:MAG: gliding motility-associated C-terminal domain-containing protein [Bacteroidetes bacterium]|nr:gliding motility-associated C-terminal domain-containing protein [Bacteroidota bacterium]